MASLLADHSPHIIKCPQQEPYGLRGVKRLSILFEAHFEALSTWLVFVLKILERLKTCGPLLLSSGVAIALFLFLSGPTSLWHESNGAILSFRSTLPIYLFLIISGVILSLRRPISEWIDLRVFAFALSLFLISDWTGRNYSFFQGPFVRGELLLSGVLGVGLLLFTRGAILSPLALLLSLSCSLIFLKQINGSLIFSDDLATFFYRLDLLKSEFPKIPFYNPEWNAGIDQRDFFATGALSPFLLFSPLIYLFSLSDTFNLIILLILFFLTPISAFVAARILQSSRLESYLFSLLSMTASLLWYRWAISYGTLGFIISVALLPLITSLVISYIRHPNGFSLRKEALLIISLSVMLLWSPSGICLIPCILWGLFRIKSLPFRRSLRILIFLLVINLPWILIFVSVSKVGSFVASEKPSAQNAQIATEVSTPPIHIKHAAHPLEYERSAKGVRDWAISTNPLILMLCIPGIFLLPPGTRLIFSSQLAWLTFLGVFVPSIKPQMEFDRMLVVFSQLAALPTAFAIAGIARSAIDNRKFVNYTCAGLVLAYLLTSVPTIGSIFERRSLISFTDLKVEDRRFVEFVRDLDTQGRILFSGCVLHQFAGGHLAPLTSFTGKKMMASSHVHNIWRYKDIFSPEYLKRGDAGINDYLDLYNVSIIAAHEKSWRDYFLARPERYREIWRGAGFLLFERINFVSNFVLSGEAQITEERRSSISVKMGSSEAVIKYRYLPFLRASSCNLEPFPLEDGAAFIKISNCSSGETVRIDGGSPWDRIGR